MVRRRSEYIPALDGVRAIAIVLVMYFHAALLNGPEVYQLPGGALGVDLFFVLSGFLITTLLIREQVSTGTISLRRFYARRALRLFPALACVAIVGAAVVRVAGSNLIEGIPYPRALLAAIFYVGNWVEMAEGFTLGVLSHTWSLAIEEQFYLMWPLVIRWLLARGARPARIAAWLLVHISVMAVLRVVALERFGFDVALNSTVTHGDGLLVGCVLALVLHDVPRISRWFVRWGASSAAAACVALVPVVLAVALDHDLHLTGLPVLYAIAFFLVGGIVSDESARSPVTRVLGTRPAVYVGRISYGLYIYHWPLFFLVLNTPARDWPVPARIGVQFAVTFVAAAVSFAVVERPALRLKERFAPRGTRTVRPSVLDRDPAGVVDASEEHGRGR